MNKAVDNMRKEEQERLNVTGRKVPKGQRFLLLSNYKDLEPAYKDRVHNILQINEPLFKAHVLKKQFILFWDHKSLKEAWIFLDRWIPDANENYSDFFRFRISLYL